MAGRCIGPPVDGVFALTSPYQAFAVVWRHDHFVVDARAFPDWHGRTDSALAPRIPLVGTRALRDPVNSVPGAVQISMRGDATLVHAGDRPLLHLASGVVDAADQHLLLRCDGTVLLDGTHVTGVSRVVEVARGRMLNTYLLRTDVGDVWQLDAVTFALTLVGTGVPGLSEFLAPPPYPDARFWQYVPGGLCAVTPGDRIECTLTGLAHEVDATAVDIPAIRGMSATWLERAGPDFGYVHVWTDAGRVYEWRVFQPTDASSGEVQTPAYQVAGPP